ncbi:FAST kinase domain-containing protein 2, mitochondrial-like [Anopheles maculipalpis]|uniref:FAST kinase domain-containing protein 2, mitochondrial-like n=1 Tax=Anopheles maculipalpis TaxID=1496333 RepID=UPI002158B009|nr:FAST kinase domain-containing protein 2, mitochondrial-like [Anopheles maculipalpis]
MLRNSLLLRYVGLHRSIGRLYCVTAGKELQPADGSSYFGLLKSATDAKEVLEFIPTISRTKQDRHVYTLPALKTLFELQKNGKSTLRSDQIVKHPRFAELCQHVRLESRTFAMNDLTECLKILTFLGVHTNSEIMTVLLQLIRHQINDVTLDHIVFLSFILRKLDRTPLIEALQIALPMLLQIQIGYKLDYENVQQLVELLEFVSKHKVNDRTVMNIVSALTLHGTNLSPEQAMNALKALAGFHTFLPQHEKLLQNVFAVLERDLDQLPFKMIDYVLKKVLDKNLEHYPMFYYEPFLKRCAQYPIDHNVGLLSALYVLKKLNKISFLHIPLLDYVASQADKLSLVPTSGIITIVAGFSNANYRPNNWAKIKKEIARNTTITNGTIPWIRYNLELLSLDIFNPQLLAHWLDPKTLDANMARNVLVDHLQLTELGQTLRLLYSQQYQGPYPAKQYVEKSVMLMLQNNDHPLLKPLEVAFGGGEYVSTQVVTEQGHVLDHLIVFDAVTGNPVKVRCPSEEGSPLRLEDIRQPEHKLVAVLYLPKSCYAINVNRLRGRFALYMKTIQALGIPTVAVSPVIWSNLPESERIPFLQREAREALRQTI